MTTKKITPAVDASKMDLMSKYGDAIADLDSIINSDSLTTSQVKAAIKTMAKILRVLLKYSVRKYFSE